MRNRHTCTARETIAARRRRATPVPRRRRRHATDEKPRHAVVARSQAASSEAAAADRLARGPGLEPNSRRCSSAPRRAAGQQQTGSRGYFRRHECCPSLRADAGTEHSFLAYTYADGAAYTAAAVRCTSYPPRSATYNVLAEHLHRRRRRRAAARGSTTAAVVRSVRGRQSRRLRNRDAYIKIHFFFSNIHNMCEHILESLVYIYCIYTHVI